MTSLWRNKVILVLTGSPCCCIARSGAAKIKSTSSKVKMDNAQSSLNLLDTLRTPCFAYFLELDKDAR